MRVRPVPEPIQWSRIESLMLRSFTGSSLSEDEQRLCRQAFKAEPAEYRERRTCIVNDEIKRRQRDGF